MSNIKSFKELKIWQKSHKFVLDIYNITQKFPKDEKFGLTSQIRRSAVSIASNIVEGSKRQHLSEYIQMLYVSQGSLEETKHYLLLGKDLRYIDNHNYPALLNQSEEIGRMLNAFINSLKAKKENVNLKPYTLNLKPAGGI